MKGMLLATGLGLALCFLCGCGVTQGQLDELSARVDSQNTRIEALDAKAAKLQTDLAAANDGLKKLAERLDAQLAKMSTEATATATAVAELRPKVDAFRQQLTQLTTATSSAQQTLIRNLETALVIYKQQYLAIEEALERLKSETGIAATE